MRSYVVVGAIFVLVAGYFVFHDPDVTFRSSDGRWADSEDGFNGRHFDVITFYFEGYKLKCHAPKASLTRATPQYWFNLFAWPSYLNERKWHVPYSDAHPEIGSYYPPSYETNCYNEGWSQDVSEKAQKHADSYLGAL